MRSLNTKQALIGLLLLAVTLGMAWGRKPVEISPACGTSSLSIQEKISVEKLYIDRLKVLYTAQKQQDVDLDAETLADRI
jgi:hypothetical protein